MKLGLLALEIGVLAKYEAVRSAHIQVPINIFQTFKRIDDVAEVHFCTNPLRQDRSMPAELCPDDVSYISDPVVRSDKPVMEVGFTAKATIGSLTRSALSLRKFVRSKKLDTLFVSGSAKLVLLAMLVKVFNPRLKIIWGTFHSLQTRNPVLVFALALLVSKIVVFSKYQADSFPESLVKKISVIRHGPLRKIDVDRTLPRHRVVFWRDASKLNGFDIARDAFSELAAKHKDTTFTFMVRKHWDQLDPPPTCPNIEYYEYPYPSDISLEKMLSEARLCVFPFRKLSTNPQLSILESLEAQIPCIISDVESNPELASGNCIVMDTAAPGALVERVSTALTQNLEYNHDIPSPFKWDQVQGQLSNIIRSVQNG